MKRIALGMCVVLLFAAVSVAAAQEEQAGMTDDTSRPAMGEGGMMGGMMAGHGMKPMMMGKMMERQMVATSDGGVVVLVGNKLLKYDKSLVLNPNLKAFLFISSPILYLSTS